MGCHLRQNDTNISEIYIGRPIYIYIGCPVYISDIRYLYPTSDIYIRPLIYNTRLRLRQRLGLGLGQGYLMSEIYIGSLKYI